MTGARPRLCATRCRRIAATALVLLLAGALAGGLPASASGSADGSCGYPAGVTANTWTPLPGGMTSVDQLDQDPCRLVGVSRGIDGLGRVLRSADAGRHWSAVPSAPNLTGVAAERLSKRAGSTWLGPLLGTGPVGVPAGSAEVYGAPAAQVYASNDGGLTFVASHLDTNGVASAPLVTHILSAATAIRYTSGTPQPEVYVVATGVQSPSVGVASAVSADRQLLRSVDDGRTFSPLPTGGALDPTVVDVNPANPDEIWVNGLGTGGHGGGVWVTRDAGTTWTSACCATATVNDIAFGSGQGGVTEVLLATDQGLLTSADDGANWTTVDSTPLLQVRTAPDNGRVAVGISADGRVLLWRPIGAAPAVTPGLPGDCSPTQLRRNDIVPATLLVTCAGNGATYRLLLDGYGENGTFSGPSQPGGPQWPSVPTTLAAVQLHQLASWKLPASNLESGAIAFDGTNLYYDDWIGGIEVVRAHDGRSLGQLPVTLGGHPLGLTVDMHRNQLLVTASDGSLYAVGLATHKVRRLAATPYLVPSFDASTDGLAWVPTEHTELVRDGLTGGPYGANTVCGNVPEYGVPNADNSPSSFVADGAGGGYVQSEDDQTLYRIDGNCQLVGPLYQHRKYSEARSENDAMACDMQTFFPQAAIWIRDSAIGTVTAYGVPYGHCPMPGRLTIATPATVASGSATNLCTVLTNATTGQVMPGRGVSLSVQGALLGNQATDQAGKACFSYVAPILSSGQRVRLRLHALFGGDVSLYPTSALGRADVLAVAPVIAARAAQALPPPLGPPPAQPPLPNAPNAPAQAPGTASNISQAQQGQSQAQSQAGMQAVAVPQRERQPQLALATVANQLETNAAGQNAMTAPAPRRPRDSGWPSPLLLVAGGVSCGLVTALARARVQVSPVRTRRRKVAE